MAPPRATEPGSLRIGSAPDGQAGEPPLTASSLQQQLARWLGLDGPGRSAASGEGTGQPPVPEATPGKSRRKLGKLADYRDALLGMQQVIAGKDAALARQDIEKAALAVRVQDLEQRCAELQGRHSEGDSANARLQQMLGESNRQVQRLESELQRARKVGDRMAAKFADQRNRTAALRSSLGPADVQQAGAVDRGEAEPDISVTAAATRIAELEAALREERDKAAGFLTELERRDAAIAELQATLATEAERTAAAVRAGADAEARLAQAAEDSATLQQELIRQSARLRELEGKTGARPSRSPRQRDSRSGPGQTETASRPTQRLMVSLGGKQSISYPLYKDVMTVGRAPNSDIRIGGKFASRRHARIVADDKSALIEDLDSVNGVLVNSEPVRRHVLHDGDLLEIGGTQFRFVDLREQARRA